jgi:hypothetical protein
MVAFSNFENAHQNLLQFSAYEIHHVPLYKSIERKFDFIRILQSRKIGIKYFPTLEILNSYLTLKGKRL